ncbi:hypothetical protein JTB14_023449 [Gonioctena quinquepunctata]|nr:hypothetical protein JTB14_023449 [Gonioctena quinquepunctata]
MEPRGGASQGENLRPKFYNLSRPNECYGAASGANFGPPVSEETGYNRQTEVLDSYHFTRESDRTGQNTHESAFDYFSNNRENTIISLGRDNVREPRIAEQFGNENWVTLDRESCENLTPPDTRITLDRENFGTNNVNQNGSFVVLDPEIQQNYWRPEVRANRQVTFSTNELFNSTLENNSPPTRQNAHSRDSKKIPSNFSNETDPINRLASLIAQSLSSNKRIDKQRLPAFSGVDTEDPRLFLRKLTRELQKFNIPIEFYNGTAERTEIIRKATVTQAQVFNKKLGSLLPTGVFLEETTGTRETDTGARQR